MRYVTISDIAKALNLSKSTVSRALHGDFMNVSEETREMVKRKAEEIGFRNGSGARCYRNGYKGSEHLDGLDSRRTGQQRAGISFCPAHRHGVDAEVRIFNDYPQHPNC